MKKVNTLALNVHGMLLQFFFWFSACAYMAFMVTTLIDYGWSAGGAAMAITVISVIGMLVQPVYGFICDKLQSEKKLTIFLLAASVVLFVLLPFALRSGNIVLIFLNMTGLSVTAVQAIGLLDAWIVGLKQEFQSINYGFIRGGGSLSYALSAQLMGTVTVMYGHETRLWIGAIAIVLTIITAITFRSAKRHHCAAIEPEVRSANIPIEPEVRGASAAKAASAASTELVKQDESHKNKLRGKEAVKLVFSSKPYCLLLAVSFFLMLSSIAITLLIQLLARDFGGNTAHIGTATAVMAASEIPFMFFMAILIKKFGFKKLLVFCCTAYVIRMIITASVTTVNGLIYVQLFHGFTFAVLLPLSMSYLSYIVDERVRSTAVTIFAAITGALPTILSNLITSAFLTAGYPARSVIIIFVISSFIGLILTIYGLIRKIWDIAPYKNILE